MRANFLNGFEADNHFAIDAKKIFWIEERF